MGHPAHQSGGIGYAVAAVVRHHRDAHGLSDSELSRQTLIPRATLQRLLVSGQFTATQIEALAGVFGMSPTAIFAEAETVAA